MVCFQHHVSSEGQIEGAEISENRSAAHHRSYAVNHSEDAAALFLRLAAYPRALRVFSAEEEVEAVQARAGTISKFARPLVEAGEVLAMVVQRQGRRPKVVGRRAPRLLWLTGEIMVSSTRAKQSGLLSDGALVARVASMLALNLVRLSDYTSRPKLKYQGDHYPR